MRDESEIYIILGPTASGKESAAFTIAPQVDGEIISVDSMKIYKTLDIGTAKATPAMQREVTHHCLDMIEPTYSDFSVGEYVQAADLAISEIISRSRQPILSGGTALYYKGILEGIFESPPKDMALRGELEEYAKINGNEALHERLVKLDPVSAEKYHPNDLRRVVRALEVITLTGQPVSKSRKQWSGFHSEEGYFKGELRYKFKMVMLDWERPVLYKRIEDRVDIMMAKGLLGEAEYVYNNRERFASTPLQAVGYKEFFPFFAGDIDLDTAVDTLKMNSRRLAKSQCTWFRKFPCQRVALSDDMGKESIAAAIFEILTCQ